VTSVEEALTLAGNVEEIMVIGGGAIYAHCLPFANRLYITHIEADIEGDTQFPNYDTEKDWQLIDNEVFGADEKNSYELNFCVYERK